MSIKNFKLGKKIVGERRGAYWRDWTSLKCENMQQQKYNPWTYITETTTNITLSPPVSIDYAENPEPVLQKQNMQQQKYSHITVTETDT